MTRARQPYGLVLPFLNRIYSSSSVIYSSDLFFALSLLASLSLSELGVPRSELYPSSITSQRCVIFHASLSDVEVEKDVVRFN